LVRPIFLSVAIAVILAAALHIAGPVYLKGIEFTTLSRLGGTTPVMVLIRDCVNWGAVPFALAVTGSVAYAVRSRPEAGVRPAPAGGRWGRAALGGRPPRAALAAPAAQSPPRTGTAPAQPN